MIRVMNLITIFVSCISAGVLTSQEPTKCGNACHTLHPEKINIHLVPHTHDDVGWLKTVDQYFYGSNKGYAPYGVQYILDSVISELMKNGDRRFIYVETSYLWSWYENLPQVDRDMVQQLVNEGRLEFISGGWCMSDEATPHYTALIDQMTLGLQYLNNTFGECGRPTVAWQIDPFGHSSEVAIEFAEIGFNGLFVGRIDYNEYNHRRDTKSLESIWRPDQNLGEAGDLFTSVLYDLYMAPAGFCFDTYCNDEPIMDDAKLHGYNADERIRKFESLMDTYKTNYKTKNILVTMGGDFAYTSASSWFRNMDKLIKHINAKQNSSFHLVYSTPSCYLKALNEYNLEWTVKEDDYFPYANDQHSYWTGYYTSRPSFKYYVYLANNILQATKQIATVLGTKLTDLEFEFKRMVAISQHHDAVSGTERQHVTDDYAEYLNDGISYGRQILAETYKRLYGKEYPDQVFGNLRNISQFKLTEEHEDFVITIYNPSSQKKTIPVKFPCIRDQFYQVHDRFGNAMESDIIPLPSNVVEIVGRQSNATHDFVFLAEDLPPLGVVNYFAKAAQAAPAGFDSQPPDDRVVNNSVVVLDNGRMQLNFNKSDGLLMSITKNGTTTPFQQNFYSYRPVKGYNYNAATRASGAYIFRPENGSIQAISPNASLSEFRGKNVFEIHQKFSKWLSQIVRLYKDSDDIEFEWLIGPLPLVDWIGVELVTKYTTNMQTNSTFYTDSNGRRWMKRVRNYRKSYTVDWEKEPASSNYYPLTTAMCIKDDTKQLTLITDRPHGGSSLKDGEIEVMLHRRLTYDDNMGVVEPLDESAFGQGLVIRGTHVIQINDLATATNAHRLKAADAAFHPVPTFAKTSLGLKTWLNKFNKSFSLLTNELPPNVHILTLERLRENEVLLRLEHLFEPKEASTYAKPETIDLKKLFSFFTVNAVQELTLGGNLEKDKLKRLKWTSKGQTSKKYTDPGPDTITLLPMQIRTFLIRINLSETLNNM